ncbi:MAG: lipoate--protein ligase family protein [Candidatus Methanomethyliaceae archaeon]|nr:lipoate--protein ligase family protein [Candidatus Methanomethyliaceae archaeon]
MERLRVIDFTVGNPFYNMAMDEAIARCVGSGRSPTTLRLYSWSPSAISIGYFQEIHEEVDLDFCRSRGIEVIRRITGGGAVIHTAGELTYSFIISEGDPAIPKDVQESYAKICSPIVAALGRLGVLAAFRPINDIEVQGRKVSGSAQTRRFGAVLQHGTLLLNLDPSLLPALKVRAEKLSSKGVTDVKGRVITLKEVLKKDLRREEVGTLIAKEFGKVLGCGLVKSAASEEEAGLVPELLKRYQSPEWLFRR